MPGIQSGGEGNFWYSIDYGTVHFTFFSTEHPYQPGSPQYQWMEQDLAKANSNRKSVPWIVLLGHRPMYCSDVAEWDDHRPGAQLQKMIEPVMQKYSVDLYLCGHMHMYEKIYPVVNGTVMATGTVWVNPGAAAHVVQATAGVFLDSNFEDPQPDWSAIRTNKWGYGKMLVNQTHIWYQFMHQDTGNAIDEFWLIKQ